MRKTIESNNLASGTSGKPVDEKGIKVEDQPFDFVLDVNDS